MKKLFLILVLALSCSTFAKVSPFVRMDADYSLGIYPWIGANISVGKLNIVHEAIYYPTTYDFQHEVGILFDAVPKTLQILPMLGYYTNLNSGSIDYILPQLYLYLTAGKVYGEAWNIYSQDLDDSSIKGFEGRYFLTYSLTDWLAIGPQGEAILDLTEDTESTFVTKCVGGAIQIPYGEGNYFMTFLGADLENDNNFVSRYTFLFNF